MSIRMLSSLAFSLVLGLGAMPALARDAAGEKIVLARAEGDALVLWDASDLVTQIVADRDPDPVANALLERGALRAAAQALPQLKGAKTIAVRVIYQRTGAVSPAYGAATFAGVERYALLTISAADAASDKGKWREAGTANTGPLPANVTFAITGALPAR